MTGRYREALDHLDAALACFRRDSQMLWTAVAANHKVQVLIDLGQFARARQALDYEQPPVKSVQRARRYARPRASTGCSGMHRAIRPDGRRWTRSAVATTRTCACT